MEFGTHSVFSQDNTGFMIGAPFLKPYDIAPNRSSRCLVARTAHVIASAATVHSVAPILIAGTATPAIVATWAAYKRPLAHY